MLNALLKLLKMPQPLENFEGGHKWEVSEASVVKCAFHGSKLILVFMELKAAVPHKF